MTFLSKLWRKMRQHKTFVVAAGSAALFLMAWGTWTHYAGTIQSNKQTAAHQEQLQAQAKVASAATEATPQEQAQTDTASGSTPNTEQPGRIKYSTSSDPRATAYSTTPPGPSPGDFSTRITRSGQVAPGTLISSNAAKEQKTYYAGDLTLSTTNITISKSSGVLKAPFTVTIPDGVTSTPPSDQPGEHNQFIIPAYNASPQPGTTWAMFADVSSLAPLNTYQIHLRAIRAGQLPETWEYHGFITVNVID